MERIRIEKKRHSSKSILDGSKGGRGRSKHPGKRKGLTWRGGRQSPTRAWRKLNALYDEYGYENEHVAEFLIRVQQDRLDDYSCDLKLRMLAAEHLLKFNCIPKPPRQVEVEVPQSSHVVLDAETLDTILGESERS